MGFLAGFGAGFNEGFDRERKIKANKEEQMFSAKFNAYMKRQDQMAQYEREAAKNVRKAKALTEGHSVPQEAWTEVYRWVRDGVDDSTIEKRLKTGRFVSTDSTPESPSMANVESQTDDAMNEGAQLRPESVGGVPASPEMPEMAGQSSMHEPAEGAFPEAPSAPPAGMAPQAAPAAGAPMPEMEESPMASRTNQRIAEAAEVSPDEVSQTLRGGGLGREPEIPQSRLRFQPGQEEIEWPGGLGEINYKKLQAAKRRDAQAFAQYEAMEKSAIFAMNMDNASKNPASSQMWVFVDPETGQMTSKAGQMTPNGLMIVTPEGPKVIPVREGENARPVGDDEKKEWAEMRKPDKVVSDFRKRQADVANMYKLGGEMLEIVESNPQALTAAAAASHTALQWTREADAVIDLLNSGDPQAASKLDRLNSAISQKILSKDIRDAGEARGLLDAKLKLGAYRLAQLENVRTGDASKFNQLRFEDIITGDNDPVRFKQNLAAILQGLESDSSLDASQLNEYNKRVEFLKENYGYSPIEQVVPSMEQFISSLTDPTIKKAYENLSQFRGDIPNVQREVPTKQAPKPLATNIPERAMEALRQNPELRGEFDAKYGEGSANRVLGGQ